MKIAAVVVSICTGLVALPPVVAAQTPARVHDLKASPATVHRGFFDASLKPVLTIDSGDLVRLETVSGNPRYFESLGVPREKIPRELYAAFEGVEGTGRGDHTLNGPIAIRGAEPGDMLEIRIRAVDVRLPIAGQGFVPNRGLLPDEFPYAKDRVLWIDLTRRTVEYAPGVHVPIKPFWGVIAVAPPASMGRVSSGPPNVFGGNLDNRDLGAGSTLFLPVFVPGALLSIGDGHAVQGYGEVCLSAVETSLKGEIQVVLHKGRAIRSPRAETPTHYITMGLAPDLDEAAKMATREMLDFLVESKGLSRENAYMLASAAMDLVVTQAVDGTKGIHAMLPKAIFRK
ncbi:MAG TPA: acetamidase/formamidase family protein [Vicinamibacterales bacterium]|nr:acetamidase/formamidase family protein [Vicinamibacterales bacterium]